MIGEGSSSSSPQESGPKVYKAIIAIGIMGPSDDVERFVAQWIYQSERLAHRIQQQASFSTITLLPLPEDAQVQ